MSKFDQYPVTRLFTDHPSPVSDEYTLHLDAGSSLSEAFVIDGGFNMVARGQGRFSTRLPKGEYLLKYRTGDALKERWIRLDEDKSVDASQAALPPTAAPIYEGTGWKKPEFYLADNLRARFSLSILIRDENDTPPADDVRILDRDGGLVARLTEPGTGWARGANNNVIGMGGEVAPGGYLLMVSTRGLRPYVMPLWVAEGFSTQVFTERRQLGFGGKHRIGPHLASASIFLTGASAPWAELEPQLKLTETAKSVLSYDRSIVPTMEEIFRALEGKFRCPMLGLVAAHLLRLRYEELRAKTDPQTNTARAGLEAVVEKLKPLMPGSPDVGALELALGQESQADFSVPPMLAHSWAILQQLQTSPSPAGSYADRIRPAVCATQPWLVFDKSRMIVRTTGLGEIDSSGRIRLKLRKQPIASETAFAPPPMEATVLQERERQMIVDALMKAGHNYSETARKLGMTRSKLRSRIEKYRLLPES